MVMGRYIREITDVDGEFNYGCSDGNRLECVTVASINVVHIMIGVLIIADMVMIVNST